MKLTPSRPPGRVTRKAGAYALEIRRLRDDGYTFEAIRSALADVGIQVSLKTVQREASRVGAAPATAARDPPAVPDLLFASARQPGDAQAVNTVIPIGSTGRDVAENFFERNQFNQLFSED
ncbi:MAG: hypothetical protein EOO80_06715 [Oxalobacteraceae bacterium]|nr:MAG: hypothetical protein EOO80_06715 [Oxalobacteraceae bacterium]